MTVRAFLTVSLLALLIGSASFAAVGIQLDPDQAGVSGFVLFFLSFFTMVASAISLLGYAIRRILVRRQFPAYAVRASLRQALMFGGFTSLLLFLQLLRVYRWWLALGLVALLACLEVVFLSYDRSCARHDSRSRQ